jgi:hypothetical protein
MDAEMNSKTSAETGMGNSGKNLLNTKGTKENEGKAL